MDRVHFPVFYNLKNEKGKMKKKLNQIYLVKNFEIMDSIC